MTAHVLFNPAARDGRTARLRGALDRRLAQAGIEAEVWETTGSADAERQARSWGEQGALVVVAGGDGTVHHAVNGLAGTAGTLAVLPLGTGNDYALALGVPPGLGGAVDLLATAPRRPVDLAEIRWTDARGEGHQRWVANGVGVGFDAHVAGLVARTKVGGRGAYLAAVLRTLWTWRRPDLRVRVEAEPARSGLDYAGPLFLCEIGNGHSVGGGFLLTPDAVPTDGLLDVCLVRHVATRRALRLLPSTFRGGHVGAPEVAMGRVTRLGLTVEAGGVAVHADGEVLAVDAVALDVAVHPGALRAVVARPGRP